MAVLLRVLCTLLMLFALNSSAAQTLHISSGLTPPVSDYFKKIFDEVNQHYPQYQIDFDVLPAERALILANRGVNDGECCRIPSVILKQYPNLIAVPQAIYELKWVAFSTRPMSIRSWRDLKNYNVVAITGWKFAEHELQKIHPLSLQFVRTPKIMMEMLLHRHAEVGVMGYLSGLKAIRDVGAQGKIYVSKPLTVKPLYLMLNKKHARLIPDLNGIFVQLHKNGTLNRLYNDIRKQAM